MFFGLFGRKKTEIKVPSGRVEAVEAPTCSVEEENARHLAELERLVANFEVDEACVVARVLAKNYPKEVFEALSTRHDDILCVLKGFQDAERRFYEH